MTSPAVYYTINCMKKKPLVYQPTCPPERQCRRKLKRRLAYYLDPMTTAQDRKEWEKEKRYGEIALKKLPVLSYSPLEEYYLYTKLGYAYGFLRQYSRAIDIFYKAYLIAVRNDFNPAFIAYTHFEMGRHFLEQNNYNQALFQLQKVEEYYQKYGIDMLPMDNQNYLNTLFRLAFCYLHQNRLEQVREIIEDKFAHRMPPVSNKRFFIGYYHLYGEYMMARKDYRQAVQYFNDCIKITEEYGAYHTMIDTKIHLTVILLLEGQLTAAIHDLNLLLKEAKRFKFNDFICEIGLLLSKCYTIDNMANKSAAIEKFIKPFLSKLDIAWFYEKTREFENLYRQLRLIYHNISVETTSNTFKKSFIRQSEMLLEKNSIIGQSVAMQEINQLIEKIAPTDLPVLIQGETGSGKELIARSIHNSSLRKRQTWLALNCGAIPETLLENELFGHIRGSFTDASGEKKGCIELASDGTLFLDEIAEMSPNMQQKLLRVLEEKLIWRLGAEKPIPVNTRFIFASNQNIEELVKAKKFREDLFYRINTIVITPKPLRDRKDDIPLLVKHFLKKIDENRGMKEDALKLLMNYPWPGNVRELENEIKRVCALYPHDDLITDLMLSENIRNQGNNKELCTLTLKERTDVYHRNVIIETLKKNKGNITNAARELGCLQPHLSRKIKQLKIAQSDYVTKR